MDFFLPVTHCEAARHGVRDITRALTESQRNGSNNDLPPFLPRILCSSLLFVDDLFSACFLERLCLLESCESV